MIDIRKIVIVFVIGVLYAILVHAIIGAVYPAPKYEDFCWQSSSPEMTPKCLGSDVKCPGYNEPTQEELDNCSGRRGFPEYKYDSKGCPTQYKGCNLCQKNFNDSNEKYSLAFFVFSSILALIAIIVGLMLPSNKALNEWIATGFLLGGLISLFFGTFMYYQYLGRYIKPVVILLELLIVIYLSYKKLSDIKK